MDELFKSIEGTGWQWLVRSDENGVFFANVTAPHHHTVHTRDGTGCCFPQYGDTPERALQASWDACQKFHGGAHAR